MQAVSLMSIGTQPLVPICLQTCWCMSPNVFCGLHRKHWDRQLCPCSCCILIDMKGSACTLMQETPMNPVWAKTIPHPGVRIATPMWLKPNALLPDSTCFFFTSPMLHLAIGSKKTTSSYFITFSGPLNLSQCHEASFPEISHLLILHTYIKLAYGTPAALTTQVFNTY